MRGYCSHLICFALVMGLAPIATGFGAGAPSPMVGAPYAHVTVTVRESQAGQAASINPHQIRVYENNQLRPVVSLVPENAQTGPIDLTVLIDDSVHSQVALNYPAIARFFESLPQGTRVRVAYASFGGERIAQDFTTNYALAAKALHVTQGASMAGGSIYGSVASVLNNWPAADGHRRELLLISDGIDINQGLEESQPGLNIALQHAIQIAQRTGVPVYTIFARGPQSLEGNMTLLNNGQSALLSLSRDTGGQAFFQGTMTPLDFTPYLNQILRDFDHQYVLTFQALPRTGYQALTIKGKSAQVRLLAPARAFIPKQG